MLRISIIWSYANDSYLTRQDQNKLYRIMVRTHLRLCLNRNGQNAGFKLTHRNNLGSGDFTNIMWPKKLHQTLDSHDAMHHIGANDALRYCHRLNVND